MGVRPIAGLFLGLALVAVVWVAAAQGTIGEETVTATFAGDATYAPASCRVQFAVNSPPLPTPRP